LRERERERERESVCVCVHVAYSVWPTSTTLETSRHTPMDSKLNPIFDTTPNLYALRMAVLLLAFWLGRGMAACRAVYDVGHTGLYLYSRLINLQSVAPLCAAITHPPDRLGGWKLEEHRVFAVWAP
jgi:hypothetical protein